jgi:hypothetical protein
MDQALALFAVNPPSTKSFLRALTDHVPAIQPALLKQQAALLADHFSDPPAYIRSLHYLLDFYSDRSRHPGATTNPAPILTAYKVRPPVLRTLLLELVPLAVGDPEQGLALSDALWNEPYLEFKLLAAMMLGEIPPEPPDTIVQRLKSWLSSDVELSLSSIVLESSCSRLRNEHPRAMVALIRDWLDQRNPFYQQLALRALLPLIEHPEFLNVPVFFRIIQPLAASVPTGLKPDLLDVIAALARRSPSETAYFLEKTLLLSEAPDTAWLIRQSLEEFPAVLQKNLRKAERSASERRS